MMDENHDQRFKNLIREFFADFLQLFFAEWAARFDLNSVEWIDKEILPNPPDGSRHLLDLVAKLIAREPIGESSEWLALVHIEIESPDKTTLLKPRLPSYYIHLWEQHGLPVLPIVLFLKVGLDGIGIDTVQHSFWELPVLTFRYLYVGLPGLDAVQYVEGDNWLGVALSALMAIPKDKVLWLGREAFRRLTEAPLTEQQWFLLTDCFNAYLPLDDEDRAEFERIKQGGLGPKVTAMNKTTFDRGLEEGRELGRELGRQIGQFELVEAIVDRKFGPLPLAVVNRLRQSPPETLRDIAIKVLTATSLAELGLAD